MRALAFLLALVVAAFGADVVPIDQRLALQIAGLTLQNVKLAYDLEACQAREK